MVQPEINDRGEVSLEGHLIGTIEGFRFTLARSEGDVDARGLRSAAEQAVAPEIRNRADRLAGAPNEEFVLATDGRLRWRGEIVAELVEGDAILRPRLLILADESLTGPDLERVQERLNLWLRHHINTQLELVAALAEPVDLEGTARGIAFQLSEHLGILPRALVADEVKGLDQDVRAKMRKHGVKFGAYHIYLPMGLKPAPRELALILFALKNGGVRQPGVSDLPHVVLSGRTSFEIDLEVDPRLYEVAGFKVAGKRAVRVDILERLADIIRPLIALDPKRHQGELPPGAAEANGFRVTVEMTSLLGCAGEDFASILASLGYRVRRTPKAVETETAAAENGEAQVIEAALAAPDETAEAEAPVEETPLTGVVEPVVETPAEDAAPEAASEAPAEPQFDEVWFPAGRRPDNRRHHQPRREAKEGEPQGRPDGQRPRFDKGRGARPERQDAAGDGRDGGRPNGKGKPRRFDNNKGKGFERPVRERREPVFDPDSPFAALAALRDRKPD